MIERQVQLIALCNNMLEKCVPQTRNIVAKLTQDPEYASPECCTDILTLLSSMTEVWNDMADLLEGMKQ